MSNIIEFPSDDGRGYIMEDNKKVSGVYVNDICAMVDNKNIYLGTKGDGEIEDALLTNMEDINDFCVMWLAIFNPLVLKYDEDVENNK